MRWIARAVERQLERRSAPGCPASSFEWHAAATSFGYVHGRRGPRHGSARASLVLVHGLGVSSAYLMPVASWLADDYDVYVPDLPGFGRSDSPAGVLRPAQLADALAEWLAALGVTGATLIGNSFGAQVAVEAALRHPARVVRLVLNGLTVDPQKRSLRQLALGLLRDIPREARGIVFINAIDYLRVGPRRLWQSYREMLTHPIEHLLPQVNIPTLVISGTRDPIVAPRWTAEAAALLPAGRAMFVPDAPHAMVYSTPRELAQAIKAFVAEHEKNGS